MVKVFELIQIPAEVANKKPAEELLAAMAPLSSTGASIELLLYHGEAFDDQIHLYVILHDVHVETIKQVQTNLIKNGYKVGELTYEESERMYNHYIHHYPNHKYGLAKAEKMLNYNLCRYYWSTPLFPREEENHSNIITSLFSGLRQYADSYISITLFPTCCKNKEISLVHQLDSSLQQQFGAALTSKGHIGASPHQVYHHLLTRHQMFTFMLCVSSTEYHKSLSLTKQVASTIRAHTEEGNFRVIPLGKFKPSLEAADYPKELLLYIANDMIDPQLWKNGRPNPALLRLPFLVSATEVQSFFQLPVDDGYIRGIQIGGYCPSNELIPHVDINHSDRIKLGKTSLGKDISIPITDLSCHGTITGMPRSGKTTLCQNILYQSYQTQRPFLILEGEKHEYRSLISVIPQLQIFTPGGTLSTMRLNLFLPPEGIPMQSHKNMLWDCLRATVPMPEPIDAIVMECIPLAYAKFGWKSYSKTGDLDVTPFGLEEFIQVCRDFIKTHSEYEYKIKMNIDQATRLRLGMLLESASDIFATTSSISFQDLLTKPTLIELAEIRSQEIKNVLVCVLLTYLGATIKSGGGSAYGNLLLFDETHTFLSSPDQVSVNLVGSPNPGRYVTNLVTNLVAEVRGYDAGILISEQRPKCIGSEIMSLTDVNISFRCIEESQRTFICGTAPFDEKDKLHLARLDTGECYIYYHKLKVPQLIETENFKAIHHLQDHMSDDEVRQHFRQQNHRESNGKPYPQCTSYCPLSCGCNPKIRGDADYIALNLWLKAELKIHKLDDLFYYCDHIPEKYSDTFRKYTGEEKKVAVVCARLIFLRQMALKKNLTLPNKYVHTLLSTDSVVHKEEKYERLP